MNALTNIQVINDTAGMPAFVVIPYSDYQALVSDNHEKLIPNEIVGNVIENDITPIRAWREYLHLTQADMAKRLGISQAAYNKQENSERLRKTTKEKVARALGITLEQLDF